MPGPSDPSRWARSRGSTRCSRSSSRSRRSVAPATTASSCSPTTGRAWGPTFQQLERRRPRRRVPELMPCRTSSGVESTAGEECGGRSTPSSRRCSTPAPPRGRSSSGRTRDLPGGDGATAPDSSSSPSGNLALRLVPARTRASDAGGATLEPGPGSSRDWWRGLDRRRRGPERGAGRGRDRRPRRAGPGRRAVEGEDPLLPYGSRPRTDLLRATSMANTGDLLLLSSVDATGHVHAFEASAPTAAWGATRTRRCCSTRPKLSLDPSLLEDRDGQGWLPGAESVHRQLVAWMRHLGIRP